MKFILKFGDRKIGGPLLRLGKGRQPRKGGNAGQMGPNLAAKRRVLAGLGWFAADAGLLLLLFVRLNGTELAESNKAVVGGFSDNTAG